MHILKRMISIIISSALILGLASVTVFADDSMDYRLEPGKNARITNNTSAKQYISASNFYDVAQYTSSGEPVSCGKRIGPIRVIELEPNGYVDVSGASETVLRSYAGGYSEETIADPIILSYPNSSVHIKEIDHPALAKVEASAGESYYIITNATGTQYAFATSYYNKAEYRSVDDTNPSYGVECGPIISIAVDPYGYAEVKAVADVVTFYCSYEKMAILDSSGVVVAGGGKPSAMIKAQAKTSSEYIYDTEDEGRSVVLNTDNLNVINDTSSAASVVRSQVQSMTTAQKSSATGADLATLYAETAVAKAASKSVSGTDILINKAAVTELEDIAKQTSAAVETALVSGGVATARYLSNTVTLVTEETGEISIRIDPDILTTEVDKIVVEAPTYAITLKVDDLRDDLTQILTITAQDVGSGFAPGSSNKKATVKVNLPNGKTTNPVTLSLPKGSGDTTYQAVVSTSGAATSSKYNPSTTTMDGKVSTSGSYTVQTNQKDFSDIENKSAEMQNAIRYLASKGIINGTGGTNFSPDGSITRAEIAALMVRALGKLDNSAKPTFKDVTTSNWYYATAAASQKAGLIKGYEDNTFRGNNQINKEQIVAVSARVLTNEMGYKTPTNTASYLGKYSDSVVSWAQPEVALATRENLVVYRTDGTFSGAKEMTRGDAAIIIYRLFQRIW